MLDVLQSLPVLTFLPVFVLTLIHVFQGSRWGLEVACVLTIFTGQVWNLVFAYYESQRTLSQDFVELANTEGFTPFQRFYLVDLPNGIRPLVYNGMMSMAGGWFFVTLCESFVLNSRAYVLPGLGSYLSLTFEQGNTHAFIVAIAFMFFLIVAVDTILWRPLIAWSSRFASARLDDDRASSIVLELIQNSVVASWFEKLSTVVTDENKTPVRRVSSWLYSIRTSRFWRSLAPVRKIRYPKLMDAKTVFFAFTLFILLPELPRIGEFLGVIPQDDWTFLTHALLSTVLKVLAVLALSTLWTVPIGIAIGKNTRLSRRLLPFVQNLAAFPAPVLFPLVAIIFWQKHWPAGVIAVVLMTIGNQWYMLFNVMSGASRLPVELLQVGSVFEFSRLERFFKIYVPAIFPSLVTGWLTAAGGAWNASIVAELVVLPKTVLRSDGIGAAIAEASIQGNFPRLVAAVIIISVTLVIINRSLWHPLHEYAEKVKVE